MCYTCSSSRQYLPRSKLIYCDLLLMTSASARYALVTGGNRGIGLEVCKQLVARGKPVLMTCRNPAQGKVAAESMVSETPSAVVKCLDLDTSDSSSIQRLAALVASDYDQQIDLLVSLSSLLGLPECGPHMYCSAQHRLKAAEATSTVVLSVLSQVNNAGILIGKTWDQQAYDSTVAVNTKGPIELSRALLPHLAPDALIVMVSSGREAVASGQQQACDHTLHSQAAGHASSRTCACTHHPLTVPCLWSPF